MSILIFVIVLIVLIVSHEFGHFITAKLSGIGVEEFGLGLPPRIKGYMWRGTLYSINWLPFGGFVRIVGEDGDASSLPQYEGKRFTDKPRSVQALVVVAGIVCNILLAYVLIYFGLVAGLPVSVDSFAKYESYMSDKHVVVTDVIQGGSAEQAGLPAGATLISIANAENAQLITSPAQVREIIVASKGEPIFVTYRTMGQGLVGLPLKIVPKAVDGASPAIGIAMDSVATLKLPLLTAILPSIRTSTFMLANTAKGMWHLLSGLVRGDGSVASSVTGPVGIAGIVGDAADAGLGSLLLVAALLSFSLAIINLVPFPALDGGRLLFIIIEGIKGSPIKASITAVVNTAGFAILILLMLAVTYKDIVNLVVH